MDYFNDLMLCVIYRKTKMTNHQNIKKDHKFLIVYQGKNSGHTSLFQKQDINLIIKK